MTDTQQSAGLTDDEMSVIPWGLVPHSDRNLPGFALGLEIGILYARMSGAETGPIKVTTHVRNSAAIHQAAAALGWEATMRPLRPDMADWERTTLLRRERAAA